MTIYKYHCWLVGKPIRLHRVSFTFADPADELDFEELFQCEVLFDQPENALTMSSHELRCPVVRSELEQIDFIANYPDWFTIPGVDRSWIRRVEREILQLQMEGNWCPTIAQVAAELSIPPRSLRRQLASAMASIYRRNSAKSLHHHLTAGLGRTKVSDGLLQSRV